MRVSINSKNWVQDLKSKIPTEFEQNLLLVKTKKSLFRQTHTFIEILRPLKRRQFKDIFSQDQSMAESILFPYIKY